MINETSHDRPPRPRRRRSWSVAVAVLITLAILITIRATSLYGLPDIGDPFDVEAFARPIPDETNAFVLYKQAFEKLGREPAQPAGVWTTASPEQIRWLGESRQAMEIWRQGTDRPDALYTPPKAMNVETLLPVIQALRSFGRLAILEGTRLEAEGDPSKALDWYIAVLRSSRHCGTRGFQIDRLVGISLGSVAAARLSAWAVDLKVDAAMLRGALDAVIEARAMTPPTSDAVKSEYISFLNTIADPAFEDPAKLAPLTGGNVRWSWSSSGPGQAMFRAERSYKQEPERSRRVYRLVTANWLAYCDRPRSKRPPFASLPPPPTAPAPGTAPGISLFVPEDSATGSVKALPPEKLASWFHSTMYAELLSAHMAGMDGAVRRDEATFANLLVALANELHKREKGTYPEQIEDLVGPYLKTLPEGYVTMEDVKAARPKDQ